MTDEKLVHEMEEAGRTILARRPETSIQRKNLIPTWFPLLPYGNVSSSWPLINDCAADVPLLAVSIAESRDSPQQEESRKEAGRRAARARWANKKTAKASRKKAPS
jgi:hypothetical protein